ncbi:MAG TPA: dUTP diphosphatase [bacterium]
MQPPVLAIEVLPGNEDLGLPSYATQGAAGLDLKAALMEPLTLQPGQRNIVPTGLKMAIPSGFEGCVRPRSGLAMKQGLTLTNSPGTIDSDYRGEVKVLIINLGQEPVTLKRGDRVAQLLIAPVVQAQVVKVERVEDTQRGVGGFGHTGR